jgi:hypothetical protein
MAQTQLNELSGTTMTGKAELWLDPMGNEAKLSDCSITVADGEVSYSWSFKDKPQQGRIAVGADAAQWSDTWHNPEPMTCRPLAGSWALIDIAGTYAAGEGPDWGWRTTLSQRPSGELVLQMTNITPWGEHGRAVRMVFAA